MTDKVRINKSSFFELQKYIALKYGKLIIEANIIELLKSIFLQIRNMHYINWKVREEILELLNKMIRVIETDSEEEADKETLKSFADIVEKNLNIILKTKTNTRHLKFSLN